MRSPSITRWQYNNLMFVLPQYCARVAATPVMGLVAKITEQPGHITGTHDMRPGGAAKPTYATSLRPAARSVIQTVGAFETVIEPVKLPPQFCELPARLRRCGHVPTLKGKLKNAGAHTGIAIPFWGLKSDIHEGFPQVVRAFGYFRGIKRTGAALTGWSGALRNLAFLPDDKEHCSLPEITSQRIAQDYCRDYPGDKNNRGRWCGCATIQNRMARVLTDGLRNITCEIVPRLVFKARAIKEICG